MKVNIKKLHADAVIPKYAKQGDAGLDLVATSKSYDEHGNVVYGTSLAIEVPQGYYAQLLPRSSVSKYDLVLANSVGVIDSGYRGELIVKFKAVSSIGAQYEVGDRIAQLIILPYPQIEFVEVGDLSESERGQGGFGSSGK